jgi:ubiquinone/menaquinone biosynthesis C-methylase UbiE
MRNYPAITAALERHMIFRDRMIIDVGCGGGDTVRWLAAQGARVTGLDNAAMLAKAGSIPPRGAEEYAEGMAQKLPFADGSADAVLFQASFHHVPAAAMAAAAAECRRVLKNGGRAVFVEPVYRAGTYTEITRLVEDEEEIQEKAYTAIVALAGSGMAMEKEEFFYLERSFADYIRLLDFFVDDAARRAVILVQARKVSEQFSAIAGVSLAGFRFHSICRLNILIKNGEQT